MLFGLLSVAALALSALLVVRWFRPIGPVDALLTAFLAFVAQVLLAGFVLSALNLLNRIDMWALASGVLLLISTAVYVLLERGTPSTGSGRLGIQNPRSGFATGRRPLPVDADLYTLIRRGYADLSAAERRLIGPLLFTAAVLALVNFDLVRNTAPHNWDSMTYHLARMAYYLQHGNLNYYDANFWAQVTHPRNSTILALYTYLVSGGNENLTQLVQFVAYGVATLAVYGICRRLGRDRFSSVFAALVFALLTECLMQAITTQNDMLLTAFTGMAVYGLLAFRERRLRKYLVLAGLSVGIAIGIKSSALLIGPSLAVVALYALLSRPSVTPIDARVPIAARVGSVTPHLIAAPTLPGDASGSQTRQRDIPSLARDIAALASAGLVGVAAFALPSGYVENWRIFGHPIGPEYVRKLHAFEGVPLSYVLENGTLNLLRFGFEFLSLDGLPSGGAFVELQQSLRSLPRQAMTTLGIDLETTEATRAPFEYDKMPSSHEDASYWGVFGFALVWPLALVALFRPWRFWKPPGSIGSGFVLALAALLFTLAQAYSGPYDPWRGRYFIIVAMFAVPVIAGCVRKTFWPWRAYLTVVMLLGCLSAFTAVLGRWNNMPERVYDMNRLEQLTRNRPNYYEPIRRFEETVPSDATVALYFGEDTFEYPLFGQGLTRTLIPINSFWRGQQPIPPEADYLLYTSNGFDDMRLTDTHLGEDWYLRKLER